MKKTLFGIFTLSFLFVACDKEKTTPITSANISINDISMNEGTGGTSNMEFSLTLSTALTQEASVKITTKDGFAKAVEDYQALNQVVVFKAGETVKKVSVTIVADDLKEGIDEFQVLLSDAVNCNIFDGIGLGVINNDDTKIKFLKFSFLIITSFKNSPLFKHFKENKITLL